MNVFLKSHKTDQTQLYCWQLQLLKLYKFVTNNNNAVKFYLHDYILRFHGSKFELYSVVTRPDFRILISFGIELYRIDLSIIFLINDFSVIIKLMYYSNVQ